MMKTISIIAASLLASAAFSQEPIITSWLQNTTTTGSYYMSGNSTAIGNGIPVNCQEVEYSTDWVYISTGGVPSFPTGPFLDGNPSQTEDQNVIYRFPRVPSQNTGTGQETTAGNIGVFVNGVSLFDYRDGVSWNTSTNSLCGGPGNPPCPGGPTASQVWNRDAVPAEMGGFDCSKGHPADGNYHHHQNPSAFKLDINVLSTICNLYDADGLYAIDPTQHSPLIGWAYDGYPIYGAYGYANNNGTGGINRIKSGYELASYSVRTHYPDGTNVDDGPAVSATYFLGYFREDYQWVSHPSEDYLDEHNGRFCVTPEFPNGTYCYFATVDDNWNSAYPYAVGPTYYGNVVSGTVATVSEPTTTYDPSSSSLNEEEFNAMKVQVFPNPASDIVAIQVLDLVKEDLKVELVNLAGQTVNEMNINAGSTIAYFDVQSVYAGAYFIRISSGSFQRVSKIIIE
ncbi:MAG: YHYH protein [Crocinitomicaceae bacterium]|nr:YHYH protein [Crocinitomicaceae bacterium]